MLHYRWDIKQEAMLLIYNYERIELNKTDTLPKMVSVFYYHSGVFCLVDGVQFNTGSIFLYSCVAQNGGSFREQFGESRIFHLELFDRFFHPINDGQGFSIHLLQKRMNILVKFIQQFTPFLVHMIEALKFSTDFFQQIVKLLIAHGKLLSCEIFSIPIVQQNHPRPPSTTAAGSPPTCHEGKNPHLE